MPAAAVSFSPLQWLSVTTNQHKTHVMWRGPVVKQAASLGATVGTARGQPSKDRKESKGP